MLFIGFLTFMVGFQKGIVFLRGDMFLADFVLLLVRGAAEGSIKRKFECCTMTKKSMKLLEDSGGFSSRAVTA